MPAAIVVFDLDGTLADSAPDLRAAANRRLAQAGRRPIGPEEARRFVGDGVAAFVERAFAATGPALGPDALADAARAFLADYEENAAVLTRPYPGAAEALERLAAAGRRLAVCTNKPQAAAERLLAELGLARFFEAVAGGDRYPVRKPDPGHLLGLLAEMGGAPGAAAMVGDSGIDAETARAAGVPFVLVSWGYARTPLADLPADRRIDRFADLPGLDLLAG